MKQPSWQQVVLILGLCATSILAARFGGPMAGHIGSTVAVVVAWLVGSPLKGSDE